MAEICVFIGLFMMLIFAFDAPLVVPGARGDD